MSESVPNAFRASAWIPYAPDGHRFSDNNTNNTPVNMDSDIDMDAPQISTLTEPLSPPQQPAPPPPGQGGRVSKFRVKLKVTEPRASSARTSGARGNSNHKNGKGEDESREEGSQDSQDSEEEWDQLADDDDIAPSSSVIGTPARSAQYNASASSTPARGGGRGGRGGRGRGRGRGRGAVAVVSAAEPPQTIFEIAPSVAHAEHGTPGLLDTASIGTGSPSPSKASRRRTRKPVEEKKKPGRKPRASKALMQLQDDAASIASESFGGTAASSPLVRGGEFSTPEVEPIPLNLPPAVVLDGRDALAATATTIPLTTDSNSLPLHPSRNSQQPVALDPSVPIPVYRLPSKPFIVQPPPKAPTGFAPTIPLDKGTAARVPVRRWRPALRAIRGIAGGQWLARTWIGEKESAYASVMGRDIISVQGVENATPGVNPHFMHAHGPVHGGRGRGSASGSALASPALSASKLPTGPGTKTPGRSKLGGGSGSTADSSRAGSVDIIPNLNANAIGIINSNPNPDGVIAPPYTSRPLSKMRHTVSATDTEVGVDDVL